LYTGREKNFTVIGLFARGDTQIMKYLMGIKNCHSCQKRSGCDKKNSPENLGVKLRTFDKENRAFHRGIIPPAPIQIHSLCKEFLPEGEYSIMGKAGE